MNHSPKEAALIDRALAALHALLIYMGDEPDAAPLSPLRPLPSRDGEALAVINLLSAQRLSIERRAIPENLAIHCCLTSANALLSVSQRLITQPADLAPIDRARHWDALVADTKTAGRAAYRAALILTDTHGD